MWFKGFNWSGIIACSILYGSLFLGMRYLIAAGSVEHNQFGLLLFIIPGGLAALLSREAPFTVLLLAIAIASPPCLAVMQLSTFQHVGLGQEIAIVASALCWCGSGALVVMLARTLSKHRYRQRRMREK